MQTNPVRQSVFPLLAAFIWGTAFVAQSVGADYLGPLTFNTARSAVAFLFVLALSLVMGYLRRRSAGVQPAPRPGARRDLLLGGLCCGGALAVASFLQQKGLETTTAGKSGFITALYIVLVPVAGLLLRKRPPRAIWISVILAVAGLWCLCITEDLSIAVGDFYTLLCALCFTVHILVIDRFTQRVDGVQLSCVQFLVATVISGAGMLALEPLSWPAVTACAGPILYAGVLSSGVGYTLQILAQRGSNPTVVSLLLSLESVFATLAGAVVLRDQMSGREYLGCALMLAAVILSQLPERQKAVRTA